MRLELSIIDRKRILSGAIFYDHLLPSSLLSWFLSTTTVRPLVSTAIALDPSDGHAHRTRNHVNSTPQTKRPRISPLDLMLGFPMCSPQFPPRRRRNSPRLCRQGFQPPSYQQREGVKSITSQHGRNSADLSLLLKAALHITIDGNVVQALSRSPQLSKLSEVAKTTTSGRVRNAHE